MNRLLLTGWACIVPFSCVVSAQQLSVSIHDPSGTNPDTAITSSYQMPDTPVGMASSMTLRIADQSSSPVSIASVLVGSSATSTDLSPNFSITGQTAGKALAASGANFEDVTLNFTPQTEGALAGYLQISYQVQQNGCDLTSTDPTTQCPSNIALVSTLNGNGLPAVLTLTYGGSGGSTTVLSPSASSPLNFGNVSTSAISPITFTLTNVSPSAITTPAVSVLATLSSAFSVDVSSLPATLAPGAVGTFVVKFAPGQTGLATATLQVGTLSYPIAGTGVIIADIDALQISYYDKTGVRSLPQAATPISFGQVVAGTNSPATLTFTVTNPSISFNAVSVPSILVTGLGFATAGTATTPLAIPPGQSITFQVVFAPTAKGTYNGTLAIGTRTFSLTGQSISSAIPDATFQLDVQPLMSEKQAHLTIQLASASTVDGIGQLAMTFTPSVANVTDDPAVVFTATSGRQLQVNVATGAQTATYNNQSAITLQTGTTAGTLTLTLTFPDKVPLSQSFTITPEQIQISSGTAVRQASNLVVTLDGFDNTYSAGKLTFTFLDTSGKPLGANPIAYDASAAFYQYFFTNNKAGGAFAVQATFPVSGDISQIGSVTVGVANTAGTSTTTYQFQ